MGALADLLIERAKSAPVPPRFLVRWATPEDTPRIMELRERQMRPEIGVVPTFEGCLWLVAVEDGVIHAAGGGVFAPLETGGMTAVVTDLLDDGTLAGKRGLLALVNDAMAAAELDLYVIVPKDREALMKALCDRGLELDGFQLRKRRAAPDAQ